jgi:hypothetical protein
MRSPLARYPAERIVLWGESLGSGVAIALAAEMPGFGHQLLMRHGTRLGMTEGRIRIGQWLFVRYVIWSLTTAAIVAAIFGEIVGFWIGRRFRRPVRFRCSLSAVSA